MVIRILILLFFTVSLQAQIIRASPPYLAPSGSGPFWDDLVGWWDMDGTSGVCENLFGPDHGANYSPTEGATGKLGDAYTFNGDTVIITGTAHGTNTFSYAFWYKPNGDGDCDLLGGEIDAMKLILYPNFRLRLLKAGGSGTAVTALTLTDGVWNFVTISRDGGTFRFGVNGVYETETWAGQDFTGVTEWIGASAYGSNEAVGDFDEFVKFSDAKTDAYFTSMYNSGNGKNYEDGE